ncbi:hypothetical protein DM860_003040 [Cuscuta australis]|uniref:Uncharacterized protein n=1 Tax=Cuscuta australis TaxID=267555 RepID=A0A328D176_9ASTE|nr:hypothetical protein DM860_003040 [Cuscuta australis]
MMIMDLDGWMEKLAKLAIIKKPFIGKKPVSLKLGRSQQGENLIKNKERRNKFKIVRSHRERV